MKDHITIHNDEGLGLLKILPLGIGDYLKAEKTNVVTWYDCRGSVAKYVSLLNTSTTAKERITKSLRDALNSGNELDVSSINSALEAFCTIFPQGEIHLNVYEPSDYTDHTPESQYRKYKTWSVAIPNTIEKSSEEQERAEYQIYFNKSIKERNWVAGDIVDATTSSFYDAFDAHFILTQDVKSLDSETIKAYEALIKSGKRPYCIVYNSEISDNDNNYVIDGHHKLMAYHNLKIRPNVLEITQISESEPFVLDVNVLSDDLFDSLFTWQLKHIFDNGLAHTDALQAIIDSPKNKFNQFIKNGLVKEYWVNGKIKLRGFYKDNKADGTFESFYENGNQKSILIYKNGQQLRYIKAWFNSGELQSECVPNDDLLNGVQINYHRSGEISAKTFYKDGKIADGKSTFTYDKNGRVTYEAEYKDGVNFRSRWFDRNGKVTEQRGTY